MISTEMRSTFPLSFLTIRRVRRSHRGSTAKNPSGRHRSQVELVTPSLAGVVGPFRPRVLAAANAKPHYGCPANRPSPPLDRDHGSVIQHNGGQVQGLVTMLREKTGGSALR